MTAGRIALGALWVTTAAAWSPFGVDWLIGDGTIEPGSLRTTLSVTALALLGWAAFTLVRPTTRAIAAVHTMLVTTFVVCPLAAEGFFRVSIAKDLFGLRRPALYGDRLTDDDYYKLRERWQPTPKSRTIHPLLGWSARVTTENPLGIHRDPGYEPRTSDVVLCFGDSFMASLTPSPHRIPDVIERELAPRVAYNYADGGYGVGQIYLRFRETHGLFSDPIVVVGIMVMDLDRSILSVRDRPKPRFRLVDGQLELTGTPLPLDERDWYAEHPPTLWSYLFAWGVRNWRVTEAGGPREVAYRRDEKRELNRALIEAIVDEARAHDRRLLFATFPRDGRRSTDWRDEFLSATLDELGVPWVNGRTALRVAAERDGVSATSYFAEEYEGHPNIRGNEILGEAIASRVRELWGEPLAASEGQPLLGSTLAAVRTAGRGGAARYEYRALHHWSRGGGLFVGVGRDGPTEVDYALDGRAVSFSTTALFHGKWSADAGGSVVVTILADGEEQLRVPLRRGDPDRLLEVPLAGRTTMTLRVDDGGDGVKGDQVVFSRPRFELGP